MNGTAASGRTFRSPFWSGITLTGSNLDLVTYVELEDWGADTVDGSLEGAQSVPVARQVTLPTGSAGPTIHFQPAATKLTVDAASLEFQAAFDPRFQTRHWLKVRIHYTASGVDRSILADVAVSLSDLVSQGLPPPTITGLAEIYTWTSTTYDPATGLLHTQLDPSGFSVGRTSILSPDLEREIPVLRIVPEGLYLPAGLKQSQVGLLGSEGWTVLVVSTYNPSGRPFYLSETGVLVRGTNLWDDGPIQLVDSAGSVLPGEFSNPVFRGDRIVISGTSGIDSRSALLQFGSMRGAVNAPWVVRWADRPRIERADWDGGWEVWSGNYDFSLEWLPSTATVFSGHWLGEVNQVFFIGPSNNVDLYVYEPLVPTDKDEPPDKALLPNHFRVIDEHHIQVWVDPWPNKEDGRVARGRVHYRDCAGNFTRWENMPMRYFLAQDSMGLSGWYATLPTVNHDIVTSPLGGTGEYRADGAYVCLPDPPPPPPPLDNAPIPIGGDWHPDRTNTIGLIDIPIY